MMTDDKIQAACREYVVREQHIANPVRADMIADKMVDHWLKHCRENGSFYKYFSFCWASRAVSTNGRTCDPLSFSDMGAFSHHHDWASLVPRAHEMPPDIYDLAMRLFREFRDGLPKNEQIVLQMCLTGDNNMGAAAGRVIGCSREMARLIKNNVAAKMGDWVEAVLFPQCLEAVA